MDLFALEHLELYTLFLCSPIVQDFIKVLYSELYYVFAICAIQTYSMISQNPRWQLNENIYKKIKYRSNNWIQNPNRNKNWIAAKIREQKQKSESTVIVLCSNTNDVKFYSLLIIILLDIIYQMSLQLHFCVYISLCTSDFNSVSTDIFSATSTI